MRLLLVTDTYPPARISGALQMRDLAHALVAQGHSPLVLTPAIGDDQGVDIVGGVDVLRVRSLRTKDVSYFRRTVAEFVLSWALLRGLRGSTFGDERWDGVIWYSPTIFLGPLVRVIKSQSGCPAYLILRDLFPDWAADAGLLQRNGLPYRFFKWIEAYQYRQADVIGVQTPSNTSLVSGGVLDRTRIEVLHNWLSPPHRKGLESCGLLGKLEGRTNFVYAGNMGVAQDMDAFVDLARRMQDRSDVGFVFVGRGSETERLQRLARELPNLLVLDEVSPDVLPGLLARCHVGIVALHPGHVTHNIPGKMLTYMHAGLPILARVNRNNDLVELVEREGIGLVLGGDAPALLHAYATRLVEAPELRRGMGEAGRNLANRMFSPESAARQVAAAISHR